jgi:hypothetical protein
MIPTSLTAEQHDQLHHLGISLFNSGQYFAAHEAWEQVWHSLPEGPTRQTYQLLIQFAVTLELYRRSIPAGVIRRRDRYVPRLAALPPVSMGIDFQALNAAMETALAPLLGTTPIPLRGGISIELIRAPQIVPVYNPYAPLPAL